MNFTKKELRTLTLVLDYLEEQFDEDLEASAEVYDADEDIVDIEVTMSDDTSEQLQLDRKLLETNMPAKEIASTIN